MGPINGPISKNGIQITDSKYVVASMGIMTRVSSDVLNLINRDQEFVKCLHSVGAPLPLKSIHIYVVIFLTNISLPPVISCFSFYFS